MKKSIVLIIIIFGYGVCQSALAAVSLQCKVTGVAGPILTNAQAFLHPPQATSAAPLTTPLIRQWALQQAPQQIKLALQPYGYFKPQIQTTLRQQGEVWLASYHIDLGPLLRVTRLTLIISGEGASNPKLHALQTNFPLHSGQPLNMEVYNNAKQKLFITAQQEGYLDAAFVKHTITIDRQKYTSVVNLQLATGERYYFGTIHFAQSPLSEKFLRRYLPFHEQQPYSATQVYKLQDALNSSNYFQRVVVEPQTQGATNHHVPVNVQLVPRKPHTYTLGIGYGTDTGVRGTLGWNWKPVNSAGDYFSTQMRISQVQNMLQAVYTIPGSNPTTDQYNISASLLQNSLKQGRSLTEQLGGSSVKQNGYWQRTYSLNYQVENFHFNGLSTENAHLLIPGASWLYLNADNPLYTSRGNRFSVRVQGASQQLVSSTTFLQTEVQDKYIYSFNPQSRVLLRGDLGYTAVHNLNEFPLSQRFYAGGTQSLRGYSYQSLGPGRYLVDGSLEYQHKIIGNWSVAIFYDEGNAMNHFGEPLQKGAGFGLVWNSPVGPMEITLGQALTKRGHPLQLQFNMGPDLS